LSLGDEIFRAELTSMIDQQPQQGHLFGRQLDCPTGDHYLTSRFIEHQGLERVGLCRGVGIIEDQKSIGDLDLIAVAQLGRSGQARSVQPGAVGAAEVFEDIPKVLVADVSVAARHTRIVDGDVIIVDPADGDQGFVERAAQAGIRSGQKHENGWGQTGEWSCLAYFRRTRRRR